MASREDTHSRKTQKHDAGPRRRGGLPRPRTNRRRSYPRRSPRPRPKRAAAIEEAIAAEEAAADQEAEAKREALAASIKQRFEEDARREELAARRRWPSL